MDFAFTEDQLAFRDAVRDLLAGTCSPADVRAAWDADDPWSADRWEALVEMGVLDVAGLGLTEVDLVLLFEEAGWAALPEPLVESCLLGDGTQKVAAAPAGATHVSGAASADLVVVGPRAYAGAP
ncbi:MAG TPA: acyl-CoA dehydrogenase family protein, partial [Acidimicrobiales bacterium]|nr:acyl-CoA dehydrogenase family protein [Acidimicrobiales bacterium]